MFLPTVKNSVENPIQSTSNYFYILLCIGMLLTSLEVKAANINCSSDLIVGTAFVGGNPFNSAYGSCTSTTDTVLIYRDNMTILPAFVAGTPLPTPPTPARNLGTISTQGVSNMGTTTPTLSSCISATYSSSVTATAGNWYCAKFVGSTDTGYLAAQWNGTTFVTATLIPAPVSASIDLNFSKPIESFGGEME